MDIWKDTSSAENDPPAALVCVRVGENRWG